MKVGEPVDPIQLILKALLDVYAGEARFFFLNELEYFQADLCTRTHQQTISNTNFVPLPN